MALNRILIRHGRVWTGTAFAEGDVLIADGKIARIGGCENAEAEFVYDAAGCVVSAGLVDIHMHMRGVSSEEFGISAEGACYPFGVTAAVDASGGHGTRANFDALMLKTGVFVYAGIRDDHAVLDGIGQKIEDYGGYVMGLKLCFDTVNASLKSVRPLEEVCAEARRRGLRVMVHSTGTPVPMADLLDCLAPGDICTHAYHGGKHTVAEDGFASLKRAKERGVVIDCGLAGGVHTDFEVLASAIGDGALPDVISTHLTSRSAFTRGGHYGMTMAMSMLARAGLDEERILRAVTSGAADAVGRKDWGRLREGGIADVAVLKVTEGGAFDIADLAGHRLRADRGWRCLLTVADGRVVYRA